MSSVTEQRLSMDELKQRNRPATAWSLSQEEWEELLNTLDKQTAILWEVSRKPTTYPTYTQIEELTRSVQALRQTKEQDGKKNERSFSLPKIRLPQLRFSPALLLVPPVLLALWALWYNLAQLWSFFQSILP